MIAWQFPLLNLLSSGYVVYHTIYLDPKSQSASFLSCEKRHHVCFSPNPHHRIPKYNILHARQILSRPDLVNAHPQRKHLLGDLVGGVDRQFNQRIDPFLHHNFSYIQLAIVSTTLALWEDHQSPLFSPHDPAVVGEGHALELGAMSEMIWTVIRESASWDLAEFPAQQRRVLDIFQRPFARDDSGGRGSIFQGYRRDLSAYDGAWRVWRDLLRRLTIVVCVGVVRHQL